jgi:outer membrane receptor protein involved in Fe transport
VGASDLICVPSGISINENPACILSSTGLNGLAAFTNEDDGKAYGGELSVDWQVVDSLRIRSSISIANDRQISDNPASSLQAAFYPTTQGNVRLEWSPSDRDELSFWARYVDDIEGQGIDGYWQANLNWRTFLSDRVVLSAGVRNLMDDDTMEFQSDILDVIPTAIETSAFANLRFSF